MTVARLPELLTLVFLIDVLRCPRCGGVRKLLAAIHDLDSIRRVSGCMRTPPWHDLQTTTAADGRFAFSFVVPPLRLILHLDRDGIDHFVALSNLHAGRTRELGDITLPTTCVLRGRLVDSDGAAVRDALSRPREAIRENWPTPRAHRPRPECATECAMPLVTT